MIVAFITRRAAERMATLRFRVSPNAKIDKVIGEYGDAIEIKLCAPAVEGKANAPSAVFWLNN